MPIPRREYDRTINADDLINGRFILLQRGKKNYFLVVASA